LCASCSSVASRRANQLGVNHILVRMNGVCRRRTKRREPVARRRFVSLYGARSDGSSGCAPHAQRSRGFLIARASGGAGQRMPPTRSFRASCRARPGCAAVAH
jgi:hypothetical protein